MIQPEPPPPPRSESPGLEAKIGRFFEEIWGFLSARRGASRDLRARRRRIGILLQESDEWESVEKVAEGGGLVWNDGITPAWTVAYSPGLVGFSSPLERNRKRTRINA